ncbi:hypothetical protein [Rhodanobacter sp. L36]|uniref:hypothetical protein n=1 Tax=Rhodanobacter sp. L36 TaxID=1747221 RepID=UPI00131CD61C|nr:hypothetical protein [Rhodanobacter sp. L36]
MRKLPPILRWILWPLGVLYALYLIVANIFINTSLASAQVNRVPETIQAKWSWAWTLWPGQICLHDLTLHGHARLLLWSAHGDSANGRVMLWPLFRRELRFGTVFTTAVTIDVQPTAIDHKPPPMRADAWRITVDRVSTSSLQQLRWGDFVVDGMGSADTGFTHQLRGGPTQVFPSRIAMPDARVTFRQWPLLHAAKFEFKFAFDPFTHEQPPGWLKAEKAVGSLTIEAATMPLALGANRSGTRKVMTAPLDGHLSADVSFDRGELAPGGRLQWNAPVAITDADGSQQSRRGQLDLAVQPDGVMLNARILPPPGADAVKAMNQLEANLHFASRRVLPLRAAGDDLRLLSGTADARWHFESLQWLTPLTASKPWLHLDGEGDIDAALRIDAGQLASGSRVDLPTVQLRASVLDNVFAGDASAHALVEGAKIATQLAVDRFTLAPEGSSMPPYLRGRALTMNVQSSANLAHLRDALVAHLQFANADVPDLRTYNRYLPGKSLYFLAGSGHMSGDLTVDGKGDVSAGRLQMNSDASRIALGVSRLVGNLRMDTQIRLAQRAAGHTFDLRDFSLNMDGVRVEGSRDPPWWARFTIDHGRLDWDRPMRLRGSATMVMKDVSLLLSLYADRSAFPKWIARIINDGQATAHAQVEAQHGDFVLDHLVASNKRIDLFAHLRIRDGKPSGDLYARWGILGLGVAMDDGKRTFHLLNAHRWYESQPDLLPPAATSAH